MNLSPWSFVWRAFALLLVSACSASSGPDAGNLEQGARAGTGSGGSSSAGGKGGGIVVGGRGGATAGTGAVGVEPGTGGGVNGCAAATLEAELTPVYLAFVYDKSGSMGDDPNGQWQNLALRWDPLKAGMVDFFTNAEVAGVEASLEFFPAPGDKAATCGADYMTPMVPMTPLSQPSALIAALEATTPAGGTPTLPALVGGLAYAARIAEANRYARAVVVLVTDGEPAIYNSTTGQIETDCAPSGSALSNTIPDIASVAAGAYAATPSVSTYVIGVGSGDSLGSLAAIAAAGGTELILIDPIDPAQTRASITSELEAIRVKNFRCDMPLPEPPPGEDLDLGLVNIDFVRSDGSKTELVRSDDCSAAGWHYDQSPATQIVLCPETCDLIQGDTEGRLEVVLGCETRVR